MMRFAKTPALLLIAALASCGPADSEPGQGGVSVEDAKTLDEAAAELDGQASTERTIDAEAK